jgi:hypothetical protein
MDLAAERLQMRLAIQYVRVHRGGLHTSIIYEEIHQLSIVARDS